MKPRKAWIIQWQWTGDHAKVEPNIFHILDSRLGIKFVKSYLKYLYLNSFLLNIEERVGTAGTNDPSMIVTSNGRIATIGTNPSLEAMLVENLTAKHDPTTGLDNVEYELRQLTRHNDESRKAEEIRPRSSVKVTVRH